MSRGRPPLPVGAWGEVNCSRAGTVWRARARYRDTDGRTREVSRTGKTKGAARAALLAHLADRGAPTTTVARVADTLTSWHDAHADRWAANTRRRYAEVIRDHVTPHLGGLRLEEVTVPIVERYLRKLTKDVGAPTASIARRILTGALTHAVRQGSLTTNVMRDVAPVHVEHETKDALTLEQVAALRAAVRERERGHGGGRRPAPGLVALVDVMLGTGARIGEVLALRWADVDLDAGTLTIAGTVVRDDANVWARQPHPKTESSHRTLHLPRFALDALTAHRDLLPPTTGDLVFPSTAGTVRDPGNVRRAWKTAARAAGLPESATPHALRRTVATTLDRGVGIDAAADQLGHTSTRTTRRHYATRAPERADHSTALDVLAAS